MLASSIFGSQGPVRYQVRPNQEGMAWRDVDKNGKIDDSDAYLDLKTTKGVEYLDFKDLKKVLEQRPKQEVTEETLVADLKKEYQDDSLQGTGVVNGSFCFDMVSDFKNDQTFNLDGDQIYYTLTPNPNKKAETAALPEGTASVSLVRDKDGLLSFQYDGPQAPPPPANAVTEAVCVRRDGLLHWVFPGEALQPGDEVFDMNKLGQP